MFYRTLKDFLLKKQIRKITSNSLQLVNGESIHTVGILIDEINFKEKEGLIEKFKSKAPINFNITLLVYRKKAKKGETINYPYFVNKDVNFNGTFSKEAIKHFVGFPFDVLISYYDNQNSNLEWLTVLSKAKFKVGLHAVHTPLNHFTINTFVENQDEFIAVFFEYLRILKKI